MVVEVIKLNQIYLKIGAGVVAVADYLIFIQI